MHVTEIENKMQKKKTVKHRCSDSIHQRIEMHDIGIAS